MAEWDPRDPSQRGETVGVEDYEDEEEAVMEVPFPEVEGGSKEDLNLDNDIDSFLSESDVDEFLSQGGAGNIQDDLSDPKIKEYLKGQPEVSDTEAAIRNFSQSSTLGLSDEGMGRLKSMLPGSGTYKEERNKERLRNYLASKKKGALPAELAGSAAVGFATGGSNFYPGPVGAVLGGVSGYGYSDSDDWREQVQDTVKGGIVGGLTGQVLGKYIPKEKKYYPGYTKRLKNIADTRAYKANAGQNAKDLRNEMNSGRMVLEEDGLSSVRGRDLRSKDEAGKPVVGWFSRAQGTGPRAEAKRKFYGEAIGEIGSTTDKIMGGATISRDDLLKALDDQMDKLPVTPETKELRQKVTKHIDSILDDSEGIDFQRAQKLKKFYEYNPGKGAPNSGYTKKDLDFEAALHNVFSKSMNKGVEKASKIAGQSGDSETVKKLSKYDYNKQKYMSYKGAKNAAQEQANASLRNRWMSPSDMYAGGTGAMLGLGGGMMSGDPGKALAGIAVGGSMGLLNKVARERGSAFVSRSTGLVADAIEKIPVLLGKYAPILLEAQKRGAGQLALTHQMLMATKPDYMDMIEKLDQQ